MGFQYMLGHGAFKRTVGHVLASSYTHVMRRLLIDEACKTLMLPVRLCQKDSSETQCTTSMRITLLDSHAVS